jgi:uncharacterized cupredoxin-like copper-binding protein
MILRSAAASFLVFASSAAMAEGFLVGRMEKVPDLTIGTGDSGYEYEPKGDTAFNLETGKGYRWWIKATGNKECAFRAPDLFENSWFRKMEVNKVEIKFGALYEIEFEREGAVELYFTPIKPGTYEWECKGLADKGLTGKINVK